jgi:hypothetical protein
LFPKQGSLPIMEPAEIRRDQTTQHQTTQQFTRKICSFEPAFPLTQRKRLYTSYGANGQASTNPLRLRPTTRFGTINDVIG